MSGAPKLKATELLRRYERTRRGPYGGAIGWLNGEGLLDTGVVIRSALVKDGTAYVRAGAGIVHDSDPIAEARRDAAQGLRHPLGHRRGAGAMSRNVLMVDNHDSFTFNIVEALERLGATVRTVRNEIAAEDAFAAGAARRTR